MLNFILKIKKTLTWLLSAGVILSMIVLVLAVIWQVIARKALGSPSKWTEELATYMLVWVSLLGASVAYARKAHLGVDILVNKLSAKSKLLMEILVHLLVITFAVWALLLGGYELISQTLKYLQKSPALGIQRGHFYLALPISGAFFVIFALEGIIENIAILSGKKIENTDNPASDTQVTEQSQGGE